MLFRFPFDSPFPSIELSVVSVVGPMLLTNVWKAKENCVREFNGTNEKKNFRLSLHSRIDIGCCSRYNNNFQFWSNENLWLLCACYYGWKMFSCLFLTLLRQYYIFSLRTVLISLAFTIKFCLTCNEYCKLIQALSHHLMYFIVFLFAFNLIRFTRKFLHTQ